MPQNARYDKQKRGRARQVTTKQEEKNIEKQGKGGEEEKRHTYEKRRDETRREKTRPDHTKRNGTKQKIQKRGERRENKTRQGK
jgi:hypothetical protein